MRRRPGFAAGIEIAAREEIARGDYRGSHRPIFIGALSPRQILGNPQVKSHAVILTNSRQCALFPASRPPLIFRSARVRRVGVEPGRIGRACTTGETARSKALIPPSLLICIRLHDDAKRGRYMVAREQTPDGSSLIIPLHPAGFETAK